MRINEFRPIFVDYIPSVIEEGVLYVSMKYEIAVHLCACGCKEKVVTPFSKDMWNLSCDGKFVTLSPSIGNFEFPCKSHYFIRKNKVIWVNTIKLCKKYLLEASKDAEQK